MSELNFDSINQALTRISGYINHTPIFSSQKLNELLQNTILFKMENNITLDIIQSMSNFFKEMGNKCLELSSIYFKKKILRFKKLKK